MKEENKNKTIGVFFGSKSPEHDVSIITAQLIISELRKLGYKVVPVYLSKHEKWLIGKELGLMKTFIDENYIKNHLNQFKQYYLDLENSVGKIVFKGKGIFSSEVIEVDIAFPAFHGSYGEDGTIQGLFEMFGIPYVGCDVPSSAIAMDKVLTKFMLKANEIPTPNFVSFNREDFLKSPGIFIKKINQELKFPVFVKPPKLGSSIGIQKVRKPEELLNAIEVASFYDSKILVEEGVNNLIDITCCVIGNENPLPSLLQESVFASDLFDFNEKYINEGGAQTGTATNNLIIPSSLSEELTKRIQQTAVDVFKVLGGSGISRIDFLVDKSTEKYYVSEVNPLPGTLYHHLWKASGINFDELLEKLLSLSLERQEGKNETQYTFESDILRNLRSGKLQSKKLTGGV